MINLEKNEKIIKPKKITKNHYYTTPKKEKEKFHGFNFLIINIKNFGLKRDKISINKLLNSSKYMLRDNTKYKSCFDISRNIHFYPYKPGFVSSNFSKKNNLPSTENWDKTMDTNIKGMFLMSREVGKIMKEQKYGRIINTASIGGRFASEGNIAYYASKGAVINFTRGLAADMAPYNVCVNAIAPGVFDTELTHDTLDTPFGQDSKARVPLKRFGKDGDLDGILIYFASDASCYCTGQTIFIDGGLTMLL